MAKQDITVAVHELFGHLHRPYGEDRTHEQRDEAHQLSIKAAETLLLRALTDLGRIADALESLAGPR